MTILLISLCLILLGIVVVQIGRVTELTDAIRGEGEAQESSNYWNSRLGVAFLIGFLILTFWSTYKYKNYMLGYGPHVSASEHGGSIDSIFLVTTIVTGIVFVITQILLFWYAYKYRDRPGRAKALFMPHDNRLELIWTAIPAIVMAFLVIQGINVWNTVMDDVNDEDDYIEIEATGFQFGWIVRYPGADGTLGTRNFKRITGANPLGQIWEDASNQDDIHVSDIVLPKGKKVRVRITSRDVLHNFNLPHFRLKMDAVPGMPTYFVFTPSMTTDEYRQQLRKYKEYQTPYDETDPEGPQKWEAFEYELACAELCGSGHFSMRKLVRIVEQEEYDAWLSQQQSYYLTTIRNTDDDPFKGQLLDIEISNRAKEFSTSFEKALSTEDEAERVIRLDYVYFNTGSAELKELSKYQLSDVAKAMKDNESIEFELSGHTDNVGDPASNMTLSQQRADAVRDYLIGQGIDGDRLRARGYGENRPVVENDTEENRAKNRRTELEILKPVIQ